MGPMIPMEMKYNLHYGKVQGNIQASMVDLLFIVLQATYGEEKVETVSVNHRSFSQPDKCK